MTLTSRSREVPAALRMADTFSRHCLVCSWIVSPTIFPVIGSCGPVPETNTRPAARTAWLYVGGGDGAFAVRMISLAIFFRCVRREIREFLTGNHLITRHFEWRIWHGGSVWASHHHVSAEGVRSAPLANHLDFTLRPANVVARSFGTFPRNQPCTVPRHEQSQRLSRLARTKPRACEPLQRVDDRYRFQSQ